MTNIPTATVNGDPCDHLLNSGVVEAWNDAARSHQRSGGDGQVTEYAELIRQATVVKVKNGVGRNCSPTEVMGIDGPLHNPATSSAHLRSFKRKVELSGVTPTTANHFGKFVILLDAIRIGKPGRAIAAGVCPVQINVIDTAHQFADVSNNDPTKLESTFSGSAQILWRASAGTGTQWAIVRLGPPLPIAINELQGQLCNVLKPSDFSATVHNLSIPGSTAPAPVVSTAENMLDLSGNAGDIIVLKRKGGSTTDWYIDNVKRHQVCMVNKVWDSPTGLAYGGVMISAMYGQQPTEGCIIIEYDDDTCGSGSGSGSGGAAADLSFSIEVTCCGVHANAGSGSCGSGSGG